MSSLTFASFYLSFFFLMIRRPPRSTQQGNSFPTRRSSDLDLKRVPMGECIVIGTATDPYRSEEHTSELQSRLVISYAVFCLKKKKKEHNPTQHKFIILNTHIRGSRHIH